VTIAILLALAGVLVFASLGARPSGDDVVEFIYVGILATMIGAWALAEMRGNMREAIRNLVIWGAVVLIIVLAYDNKTMLGF
jgi:hypothetical protein